MNRLIFIQLEFLLDDVVIIFRPRPSSCHGNASNDWLPLVILFLPLICPLMRINCSRPELVLLCFRIISVFNLYSITLYSVLLLLSNLSFTLNSQVLRMCLYLSDSVIAYQQYNDLLLRRCVGDHHVSPLPCQSLLHFFWSRDEIFSSLEECLSVILL